MKEDLQAAENCVGQLGLASQFWFCGGGWSSFFTSSTGWTCDFSPRGRSPADHRIWRARRAWKVDARSWRILDPAVSDAGKYSSGYGRGVPRMPAPRLWLARPLLGVLSPRLRSEEHTSELQ